MTDTPEQADELAKAEAEIGRLRQIDKLASLLHEYPMPKVARLKIATSMYDGGARIDLTPPPAPAAAAEPDVPRAQIAAAPGDGDSPLRAKLRAQNPELVAMIEAAQAAKDAGDATEWLRLHAEIRPKAQAELRAMQEGAAKIDEALKQQAANTAGNDTK